MCIGLTVYGLTSVHFMCIDLTLYVFGGYLFVEEGDQACISSLVYPVLVYLPLGCMVDYSSVMRKTLECMSHNTK